MYQLFDEQDDVNALRGDEAEIQRQLHPARTEDQALENVEFRGVWGVHGINRVSWH